jgi:hypothetical protein
MAWLFAAWEQKSKKTILTFDNTIKSCYTLEGLLGNRIPNLYRLLGDDLEQNRPYRFSNY